MNFIIRNNKILFSVKEIQIKLSNNILCIFDNFIELKPNNILLCGGIISFENYKIVLCNKYSIGICFSLLNSEIDEFYVFGKYDLNKDIITEFSSDMNKYFLGISGVGMYKIYDQNYLNKSGIIQLKENIDKALDILTNSKQGVMLN